MPLDQLGNRIELAAPPRRVVSLVPSITELLCDLGLRDRLVGCTKFCVHPVGLWETCQRIGGTKRVHVETVRALRPDLIVANKEENDRATVAQLQTFCPVWTSDVPDLLSAERMIAALAELTHTTERANAILAANRATLDRLALPAMESALYLIWRNPYLVAGGDTYISAVLRRVGLRNVVADRRRYPELRIAEITDLAPQRVLLSSEPFPFGPKQAAELRRHLPRSRVQLVDGEFFSWYGSRLGHYSEEYSFFAGNYTP